MSALWYRRHWFPTDLPDRLAAAGRMDRRRRARIPHR